MFVLINGKNSFLNKVFTKHFENHLKKENITYFREIKYVEDIMFKDQISMQEILYTQNYQYLINFSLDKEIYLLPKGKRIINFFIKNEQFKPVDSILNNKSINFIFDKYLFSNEYKNQRMLDNSDGKEVYNLLEIDLFDLICNIIKETYSFPMVSNMNIEVKGKELNITKENYLKLFEPKINKINPVIGVFKSYYNSDDFLYDIFYEELDMNDNLKFRIK